MRCSRTLCLAIRIGSYRSNVSVVCKSSTKSFAPNPSGQSRVLGIYLLNQLYPSSWPLISMVDCLPTTLQKRSIAGGCRFEPCSGRQLFFCPCIPCVWSTWNFWARVGIVCHVVLGPHARPHTRNSAFQRTRMSLALSTDDAHPQHARNNTRPAFPTLSLPCTRRQRVVERKTQLEGMNASLERRLS